MDGNGRMARLLMNLMMALGVYPWTIVRRGGVRATWTRCPLG
jgi:hypothetical protein